MRRLLFLAAFALPGCAASDVGPSLARRPIESLDLSEPVREPAPEPAASGELARDLAALLQQARAGEREFGTLLPRATTAAASAGAEGTESWIAAQQLLSALEGARAGTRTALTRVDSLLAERVLAGDDAGLSELQAAQQEIGTLDARQQAEFEALRARVSR